MTLLLRSVPHLAAPAHGRRCEVWVRHCNKEKGKRKKTHDSGDVDDDGQHRLGNGNNKSAKGQENVGFYDINLDKVLGTNRANEPGRERKRRSTGCERPVLMLCTR